MMARNYPATILFLVRWLIDLKDLLTQFQVKYFLLNYIVFIFNIINNVKIDDPEDGEIEDEEFTEEEIADMINNNEPPT